MNHSLKTRALSFLMALVMVFGMFPVSAMAEETIETTAPVETTPVVSEEPVVLTSGGDEKTYFTVTFDAKNDTDPVEQSVEAGVTVAKPEDPAFEGYAFQGWFCGETAWDFETPITEAITLTAVWEEATIPVATTYPVTFKADNCTEDVVIDVEAGSSVAEPEVPVREGYTFQGWFSGETAWDFKTPITEAITLTAFWEEATTPVATTYPVTFKANNGTEDVVVDVEAGSSVVEPEVPVREGYTFQGWYCSDNLWDFSAEITGEQTLIAGWKAIVPEESTEPEAPVKYTVTFDTAGGSAVEAQTVAAGQAAVQPEDPTCSGFAFQGWYLGEEAWSFETAVTSDVTLTAVWVETPETVEVVEYKVTFNANKGSGTMEDQIVSGTAALNQNVFTYVNHEFLGWNTAANGSGKAYSNGEEVTLTENVTLYAQWKDVYYKTISHKTFNLAPGVLESEIILNNAAGTHQQVAHVVEVDIDNPYTKVIPSSKGMIPTPGNYGVQIMSQQAAFAEASGYGNVVAAMNISLSWYDSAYYLAHPELVGEPLGYLILDGVQYTNSKGQTAGAQTCLVINYDEKGGVARPDNIPKTEIRATSSSITGWEEQVIPANFGFLVKDGKNQYAENHGSDAASRSFIGIKENGDIVIVMNDGRQAPYSAGFNNYEMAEFMLSMGCVQAVNGDGGGSSAFLSQRPGEDLKVNCSPSDGAERPTTHGILVISTAQADGAFARANISSDDQYYTPGSTVTFTAFGTDLVGTPADIPAGVSWQIKEDNMGTIENGVFTSNGTVGTVTAQMVYSGKVVGEHAVEMVIPEEIHFGQSIMTIPYGKEVSLKPIATINGGLNEVALNPGDITFTFTNDTLGILSGFMFTSVSEEPENSKGTVKAVLNCDPRLTATAEMSLGKGSEVLFDFESEEDLDAWNTGDVNGNDAGFVQEMSIASSEDGQVHNGEGSLRLYMNPVAAPGISNGGYGQLDLYLDEPVIIENAKSIGFWAYIPDEYEHCWIRVLYWYDPDGDGKFDKKNTISIISQPEVYNNMSESGWKYFSVDVSAYSKIMIAGVNGKDQIAYNAAKNDANNFRFIEFMFPHTNTNDLWKTYGTINGPQTVYIDNITADFSDAVDDREAPIFGTVSLNVNDVPVELKHNSIQETTTNSLSVMAAVTEDTKKPNATGLNANSAEAYVDGIEVPCTFSNGRMSISDVIVADGVHRVKFEIADNMGNKSVVVRLVKVNSGVDASTVQLVPKNASLDSLYGGSVYWMDLKATDVETIQSIAMRVDLNSLNHWELSHTEYAPGFTGSYSIDTENNAANITITRTGINTQTGEAVIASLPIRIVSFDTDIHVEGYDATTYWTSYGFWPYDLKVDVDMGKITYAEGYTTTVLNGFSNEEFSVDTELQTAFSDTAFKAKRGTAHVHTATAVEDKAATCTNSGYSNRTYCEVCESVVSWGKTETATGHNYVDQDGLLACKNCSEKYSGVYESKTYFDGVLANGWIEETYYYIDGVMVTGQYYMDGVLYTFDENGVYDANYAYTGFYVTNEGQNMYFAGNKPLTGYQYLLGKPYYFNDEGYGYEGEYILCGETCLFEDGLYVSCSTAEVMDAGMAGKNAEYVIYADGTMVLGGSGETYSFTNHGTRPFIGYTYKVRTLKIGEDITRIGTYFMAYSSIAKIEFAENGKLSQIGSTAFYEDYALQEITLPSSITYLSNMAFGKCSGLTKMIIPASVTSINSQTFKNTPNVTLHVEKDSYAVQYAVSKNIPYVTYETETLKEIREVNGVLYYFEDGVKTYAGLIELDGNYYYVRSSGQLAVNCTYWVTKTNDLLPAANYKFDAEGKMINVPVVEPEEPDTPDVPDTPDAPDIPEATGKIVNENGTLYYYLNGARNYAGLIYLDGCYYYVRSSGQLAVSCTYWVTKTNDLLPAANYQFDAQGKILNAPSVKPEDPDTPETPDTPAIPEATGKIVNENGTLYYHENGMRKYAGLIYLDGCYYYVRSNGQLAVSCTYWVTKTNDLLPAANYQFAADGKIINK